MNGSPMSTGDVLDRAATRLSKRAAWVQHVIALDRHGDETRAVLGTAVCWCAMGAIEAETEGLWELCGPVVLAFEALPEVAAFDSDPQGYRAIAAWNDAPGRTQPEVVSALRKAAALARTEEGV